MYKTVETRGAFGSSLFALRRGAGLSAEKFADTMKVGRNTVWRWENGKALPQPDKFATMCIYFTMKHGEDVTALQNAYAFSLTNPYLKKGEKDNGNQSNVSQ